MIVTNVEVYDLQNSIKASKYPFSVTSEKCDGAITETVKHLARSAKGEGHDQFLTGIRVNFDVCLTVKCWTEAERYRFLEFVSSQSTMHCISKFELPEQYIGHVDPRIIEIMEELKQKYNQTKSEEDYLRLLYSNPCGFRLTARLTTNYRCLKTIYAQRKNHRLPEWQEFCNWIKTLPHANDLIYSADGQGQE